MLWNSFTLAERKIVGCRAVNCIAARNTKQFVTALEKEFFEIKRNEETRQLHNIKAGGKLIGLYEKQTGSPDRMYYVYTDRLGSYHVITDETGSELERLSFDPWGLRRNSDDWGKEEASGTNHLFSRGFTGHEHLDDNKTINMNGRLYDPVIATFFSPDPYVADATSTQDFNRYSYARNNPLMYTDPTGYKWWAWALGTADVLSGGAISAAGITTAVSALVGASGAAATTWSTGDILTGGTLTSAAATVFPFTNQCYEMQKYISPIAFKPNFAFGSIQNGLGFDVSIGMLKGLPGQRFHAGATYWWSSYGGYNGWETRVGGEMFTSLMSYSVTRFTAGEYSQTTGMFTFGGPFGNIQYENDYMFGLPFADNGDRWRTAAVGINIGLFSVNLNMFTGDPDVGGGGE